MTKTTVVSIIDDIDGSAGAETVTFALDAKVYEIDLAPENRDKLRSALAPYIEAARSHASASSTSRSSKALRSSDIRAWASQNGYEIGDRGRIPADIARAYEAAH